LLYGAQAIAAEFVATLKEYPPHQRPQSFNLDQIMERLQRPAHTD
jgi:arylsulfatase